ncbi:ParB family protein [Candidatus Skiveiella danica]|uniref:ParB family protein n=1 Tax=Candidatus Skiveiella danica TaxID=3386177 RepID=UPI0009C5AB57|nr:MAG: ParB-like nuclease domain protein [Alphaproteobacteria bacterium ADurb.Bin100]
MSQKGSMDERRRLVAQSLQVGNPGNNARDLEGATDARATLDQIEHQIELSVEEVRPYENNPRRSANVKFDDIKESIRTSGLRSPLTVTRRPGESHYVVEAGGNTRLLALQQLWSETGDPRYRQLIVLFRPWRSESHVLSAHLIENEQRGDMSFWDKATGIVALKRRLEAEQSRQLTLRPLEDVLHAMGLAVNTATLGLYLFATERLRTLGEAVVGLTGLDVKTLQPRLNAIKRYAQARQSLADDDVYATVFEPVFSQIADKYPHTGEFSVAATGEACEAATAAHLGEAVEVVRGALRPASARGGQGEALAPHTDTTNSTLPADVVAPVADADLAPVGPEDLVRRVQAFADVAGLGHCVEPAPKSSAGFRLSPITDSGSAPTAQQRAWWLLAGVGGQVDAAAIAPVPLDQDFLFWLADPADAAATAFWEVLTCLRRTRGNTCSADVGSDTATGEEEP